MKKIIKNNKYSSILVALVLFFYSCQKDEIQTSHYSQDATDTSVLAYLKKLGISDSRIKDLGKNYLVDGDILIPKNTVISTKLKKDGAKVSQYNFGSVNQNIVIAIDPSMNNYVNEVLSAITEWNNVEDCSLDFSLYTPNATLPANVTIRNIDLSGNTCGQAFLPQGGAPSQNPIDIDIAHINSVSNTFEQRKRTIAHEIGHAIGFLHSNISDSQHLIPGTPTSDASSLMNGGQCGIGATTLSYFDKVGVRNLYFQPTATAQLLPGGARDISVGADGSAYIIGTDYNYNLGGARIFKWINNNWSPVGGYAISVAVGPNGAPWVVNSFGSIFKRENNNWTQLPGGATDIAIGADGSVYIVGTDYNFNNGGARIFKWENNNWSPQAGAYGVAIAVAPNGQPWVVNTHGGIFTGSPNNWTTLFGAAKDIGIGANGSVYIIGIDSMQGGHGVFTWTGNSWNKIGGAGVKIAAGPNGRPWLVNSYNAIFKYD